VSINIHEFTHQQQHHDMPNNAIREINNGTDGVVALCYHFHIREAAGSGLTMSANHATLCQQIHPPRMQVKFRGGAKFARKHGFIFGPQWLRTLFLLLGFLLL